VKKVDDITLKRGHYVLEATYSYTAKTWIVYCFNEKRTGPGVRLLLIKGGKTQSKRILREMREWFPTVRKVRAQLQAIGTMFRIQMEQANSVLVALDKLKEG
jgi:hypothetical protein